MNAMGEQLGQLAADRPTASESEVSLHYEGGEVAEALRSTLTHVRVGPQVKEIPDDAFSHCKRMRHSSLQEDVVTKSQTCVLNQVL